MNKTGYNILVGGRAGEGVETTARMIAELALKSGWHYFLNSEFHNAIKGCHNNCQVNVRNEIVLSHNLNLDLVMALDEETLHEDLKNLKSGGLVILDSDYPAAAPIKGITYFSAPLKDLAKTKGGSELMKNSVCLGLVSDLLQVDKTLAESVLEAQFKNKDQAVIRANLNAFRAGYEFSVKTFVQDKPFNLKKMENNQKISVSGNVSAARGAIRADCKFFSAYPMTPSSSILHYLAKQATEYDLSVYQTEDELAAINMAIGAGYAGVRALTATSGGGYALMGEALSFAGMAEIPVVIIEVQRPGPSTGLPTRTGQGDLRQVLHAGQGDFPHIVLAPGTIQEAFDVTFEAFNLADRYQCPVTVLMDKYLGESWMSLKELKRYHPTLDGISSRCLPGQIGGRRVQTSYEHDEDGFISEKPEVVTAMNDKRMKKLVTCQKKIPPTALSGPSDADITLVLWGSTYGPAREALSILDLEGIKANILQIKYLNPLPPDLPQTILKFRRPILIEGNCTAELGGLLREKTGIEIKDKILNYSGRPFSPEEICERVKSMFK